MKKLITLFVVLAVAQLVLIGVTWQGGQTLQSQLEKTSLLAFDKNEIDHVLIKEKDSGLILEKKDGAWLTESGFPADKDKLEAMLEKLQELQYGMPVATSNQALKRFKVAEDQFERYVQLKKGAAVVGNLYLGTGAGARQTHVRTGEQDGVYIVAIGSYDLPASEEQWQDKSLLHLDASDVRRVEMGELVVQRQTGEDKEQGPVLWESTVPMDGNLAPEAVDNCITQLTALDFSKVLGNTGKPEYGLDDPVLDLNLEHTGGQRTYRLGELKESEDYVLKVSDRQEYFQLAGYIGKPLVEQCDKGKWIADEPEVSLEQRIVPEDGEVEDTGEEQAVE